MTVPAWFAVVVTLIGTVLGVAIGVLGAHTTLGKDVRQALTELKDHSRRLGVIEAGTPIHFHRRANDSPEFRAD